MNKLHLIAAGTMASLMVAAGGCADQQRQQMDEQRQQRMLPPGSQVVAEGVPPLSYLIPDDGARVQVWDLTTGSLVHTADLPGDSKGSVLVLDAKSQKLLIRSLNNNDQAVLLDGLSATDEYRITLLPEGNANDVAPATTPAPLGQMR
ncbi:MAG: hypothetical protein IT447_12035 [Phycisphaerales bacterium]|jgi:hypothetical protein|nr:hypothetical protein [Phycisphaerales bacterium]